jgi:type II secretory pathway pseudopilin PulG
MTPARRQPPAAAFTLLELLIGMALALTVMAAVLSAFAFLGRQLVRLSHQQTLETEARRTLAAFAQDARLATALTSPGATALTFTQPTATGTTTVAYTYYSAATTVSGVPIPAGSLTRTSPSGGTPVILVRNLQSIAFTYFDASDNRITDFTNKLSSIKKIALAFNTQTGRSADGTLTPVFSSASPRISLRNKPLLN